MHYKAFIEFSILIPNSLTFEKVDFRCDTPKYNYGYEKLKIKIILSEDEAIA